MDEHFEYRTGRTDPIKSSRGLIAVLLILVIFLGGLVSALSIMNIHLFRKLKDTQTAPLFFTEGENTQAYEDCLALAGMALREADPVYQQLHELPEGLYVARVEPGSPAEKLGIQPGDVIVAVDNAPVSTLEAMRVCVSRKSNCRFTLWRDGQEIPVTITN